MTKKLTKEQKEAGQARVEAAMKTPVKDLEDVLRLNTDLIEASRVLGTNEARYLVDMYYLIQSARIASAGQVRSMIGEPVLILEWFLAHTYRLEREIQRALKRYADDKPIGVWLQSIKGIGPVLSAGLIAHIDIRKAPTAGHIWAFAGLDPTKKWKKGEKRPWNATLKTLCWKIGDSFVKVSGIPDAFYGKVYVQRKEQEMARNEAGAFADQAKEALKKTWRADSEAPKYYKKGLLPPAHVHARATRYAVKLFLSHLHGEWYRQEFGEEPPKPYPIAHLGHVHEIQPEVA